MIESNPTTPRQLRPREVERYIARQVRKLDDRSLLRLLAELRALTAKEVSSSHG